MHDIGTLTIENVSYKVKNCEKVGKCVFHYLEESLPKSKDHYIGVKINGEIDYQRRSQLRSHHTGTHIVFASCREYLGPHIW